MPKRLDIKHNAQVFDILVGFDQAKTYAATARHWNCPAQQDIYLLQATTSTVPKHSSELITTARYWLTCPHRSEIELLVTIKNVESTKSKETCDNAKQVVSAKSIAKRERVILLENIKVEMQAAYERLRQKNSMKFLEIPPQNVALKFSSVLGEYLEPYWIWTNDKEKLEFRVGATSGDVLRCIHELKTADADADGINCMPMPEFDVRSLDPPGMLSFMTCVQTNIQGFYAPPPSTEIEKYIYGCV